MVRFLATLLSVLALQMAHASTELQQCYDDCLASTQPGYELKQCLATCVASNSQEFSLSSLLHLAQYQDPEEDGSWCETYEEDCHRDPGGDDGSGPDDDGEPDRGDDGYEGI